MNTLMGIALDAWVTIDGDCPMTHEVSKSQAQLELGHSTGALHLVMSEEGVGQTGRDGNGGVGGDEGDGG